MDNNEKSWLWNGKMIDCNGRVSRIFVNKPDQGGKSEFLVELLERDGHATAIKGSVKFNYDERKNLIFSFENGDVKNDQVKISWSATLKPSSAGSYAKDAAFGTYETTHNDVHFSNGVMVLWQFI